jgi:hypothetical protein
MGCIWRVSNNWLQGMLWMVARWLGSLYTVPRRLRWRGQHILGAKCCYGEINSLWKLSDHTSSKNEKRFLDNDRIKAATKYKYGLLHLYHSSIHWTPNSKYWMWLTIILSKFWNFHSNEYEDYCLLVTLCRLVPTFYQTAWHQIPEHSALFQGKTPGTQEGWLKSEVL